MERSIPVLGNEAKSFILQQDSSSVFAGPDEKQDNVYEKLVQKLVVRENLLTD